MVTSDPLCVSASLRQGGQVTHTTSDTRPIARQDDAEAYVAMVCFKHGPPERVGVELEWTVHHRDGHDRPLDPGVLASALGNHAPTTVAPHSTQEPLPRGSLVTVEPGGQVEISSLPSQDVGTLVADVQSDLAFLDTLLEPVGLVRGTTGIDPHRAPARLLDVPRYSAMQELFDTRGPWGSSMMCSTASTQVCLDAGEPPETALRIHALHSMGPTLVALFANSPVVQGTDTGWASNRLRATLGTCPPVTHPLPVERDPVETWVERVLTAPVMCVRRESPDWTPGRPMSFAGWLSGGLDGRPTYDDLDYHLTTLFPPVRPRGYLEVRYLDAQPPGMWHHPVILLTALLSSRTIAERACELTEHCADQWLTAARRGLADAALRRAAAQLVELAAPHLDATVPQGVRDDVVDTLRRRTTIEPARRQPV